VDAYVMYVNEGEVFYQSDGPGRTRLTEFERLYLAPDKVR